MAGGERSKGGCWTCKLRKKKCDEKNPQCSICQSFGITCYGYGVRPSWVTGGAQEKEIVEGLRLKVKEATSRKRKSRGQSSSHAQQDPVDIEPPAPRQISHSLDAPRTLVQPVEPPLSPSRAVSLVIDWPPAQVTDLSSSKVSAAQTDPINSGGAYHPPFVKYGADLNEDEVGLWMHYLDNTFPLQFPFYKPTTKDGGRGWLLAIVMQTEPLYHAVLSVASYHQHFELLDGHLEYNDVRDCPRFNEQLRRYTLSLQKLQNYLVASTSNTPMSNTEYLSLLACIVFLISLEAFLSAGDDWTIHLQAAATLITQMKTTCENCPQQLSVTQGNALQFISGALTWYDTLSGVSIKSSPSVPPSWYNIGPIDLPLVKIMGCEDWAISKIRDIALLRKWKESMQAKKALSLRDLASRATDIETFLEDHIKSTSSSIDTMKSADDFLTNFDVFDYGSKYINLIVTRIFAHAALTYLFVTVSGANPELSEIQSSVARTISSFRALPHPKFFRSLSWPLCISGCMAMENHQETFREFGLPRNADGLVFGSSKHVLGIMEKCWEMRKDGMGEVDWLVAMRQLGLNVLLV